MRKTDDYWIKNTVIPTNITVTLYKTPSKEFWYLGQPNCYPVGAFLGWKYNSGVQHLPSMHKSLSSVPKTALTCTHKHSTNTPQTEERRVRETETGGGQVSFQLTYKVLLVAAMYCHLFPNFKSIILILWSSLPTLNLESEESGKLPHSTQILLVCVYPLPFLCSR